MFDEDLAHRRWYMAHYNTIHNIFSDSETLDSFSFSAADLTHPNQRASIRNSELHNQYG